MIFYSILNYLFIEFGILLCFDLSIVNTRISIHTLAKCKYLNLSYHFLTQIHTHVHTCVCYVWVAFKSFSVYTSYCLFWDIYLIIPDKWTKYLLNGYIHLYINYSHFSRNLIYLWWSQSLLDRTKITYPLFFALHFFIRYQEKYMLNKI